MVEPDTSVAEELQKHPLTATWPVELRSALLSITKIVQHPANHVVFSQGTLQQQIFLLCEGRVALDMHVPAKGDIRILTVGKGELLAWSALIGDCHMTTSARTLESTRAIAIDGLQLQALCEQEPHLGYLIFQQVASAVARRLVATRLQLLDLYSHPATSPWGRLTGRE